MYLYFIFVADDARLSEALHRSSLSGTHDKVNPAFLLPHCSAGNPFRTMEEELLRWEPAVGFPCLDADDCANPSNAARIPDVEVQFIIRYRLLHSLNQLSGSPQL
jgi:hypothetical protein